MKVLRELHSVIDFRKINVLGEKADDADRLFELIRTGEIETAEEVRSYFYTGSPHAARYGNRLQQQLRRRLINAVFSTDVHQKDYWEQYFETAKKALVCNFLWNKGKAAAAAEIGAEVAREAEHFHFSRLGVDICLQLIGHYAVVQRDTRKHKRYEALYERFCAMDEWVRKAERYYFELSMKLQQLKAVRKADIRRAEAYRQELAAAPPSAECLQFVLVRNNINVYLLQMQNDLAGILATCEATLQYFDNLPFDPPDRARRSIYFNLVPAALQNEAYDKAAHYIDQLKGIVKPGGHNWIGIHQYQTFLAFRLQDLPLARRSIQAIRASKHHHLIREEVTIYDTYLALLEGELPKLGKFLNETIHFSTDKKGMNINILILQVLIFLRRGDRPAIIEKLEALQAYAYRHLARDPATRRSELFFRLLFQLVRSGFDPEAVEQRVPGLLQELKGTPRHISGIDVEVVDYGWLWEMAFV